MADSDSSDDVPLSQLTAKAKPAAAPAPAPPPAPTPMEEDSDGEAEFDDAAPPPAPRAAAPTAGDSSSSDDDAPLSQLMKKPANGASVPKKKPAAPKRKAPPKPEPGEESEEEFDFDKKADSSGGDDSDDSDDVPLAALAKKAQAKPKAAAPKPARKPAAPRATTSTKKQKGGLAEQAFYQTLRGRLLQEFLKRWWYAVDWPSASAKAAEPEDGFERLEGYPGVHFCTAPGHARYGEVVDVRDHSNSPCFANYYDKSSAELKKLCLECFGKQLEQLLAREPDNERYIKKLKAEMRDVERIDVDKADAEAARAVKTYRTDKD